MNYLLQKESVSRRLESAEGISYSEFTYLLLQAYDFLQLFDRFGCTLQMGGRDQWGNITAGIDLVRKLRARKAHGLVMPLMTTASGVKFGKTEVGTVWLDPARTSPFRFYQFWLNTDDRDVAPYLKYFTFLARPAIDELGALTKAAPEKREAQRVLARGGDRARARQRAGFACGARVEPVIRRRHDDAGRGRGACRVRGCAVDRAGERRVRCGRHRHGRSRCACRARGVEK